MQISKSTIKMRMVYSSVFHRSVTTSQPAMTLGGGCCRDRRVWQKSVTLQWMQNANWFYCLQGQYSLLKRNKKLSSFTFYFSRQKRFIIQLTPRKGVLAQCPGSSGTASCAAAKISDNEIFLVSSSFPLHVNNYHSELTMSDFRSNRVHVQYPSHTCPLQYHSLLGVLLVMSFDFPELVYSFCVTIIS